MGDKNPKPVYGPPVPPPSNGASVNPSWYNAMIDQSSYKNPGFTLTNENNFSVPGNNWLVQPPAVITHDDPAAIAAQQAALNPPSDPYLDALYSILGSNTADVSGYNSVLNSIANQRKQTAKRYQTYTAQIADIFGNLGRKSDTYAQEQAAISQSAAGTRAQMAAQQAQLAEQARAADATRLKAATEARAALGLGEAASSQAGGDLATQQLEQSLGSQAQLNQSTMDTLLANEALAKLVSSRQAAGFDIAGAQAQQQLNKSYEDQLAALAGQEAQTKLSKSQAISAGALSPAEQISILQAAQNYKNAAASSGSATDPASIWTAANPKSADAAVKLSQIFVPWFTKDAPSTDPATGKTPTLQQLVTAFSKAHPSGAQILASDPALYNFLQVYTGLK